MAGLRDRALIGAMLYTFGRVGAVIAMDVEGYRISSHQRLFLLHEIDERDSKADAIPDVSHCAGKIGVVGYDDRLLVIPVEPIDQETRGEVHVRPLFLRVSDEDVRGQPWHGFDQRTAFDPGPEGTIVDLQTGCDVQRSEVDQLTLGLSGFVRARLSTWW